MTVSWLLVVAGAIATTAGIGHYALRIPAGNNPKAPVATGLALLASTSLAVAGGVWALSHEGAGGAVLGAAGATLLLNAFALLVHSQRRVPTSSLAVGVGDRLLPFEALTADAEPFSSECFGGKRVLLKFFRGEWCPFCQAELKRFEAMREQLAASGVHVVALSKDPPEAARRQRERDGLHFTLLCDPELEAIRRYGVEHQKALEVVGDTRIPFLGLNVGLKARLRHMAAPTTLLVDETGIVRWIDQTEDYKVRSNRERVLDAVHDVFGRPERLPRETTDAQATPSTKNEETGGLLEPRVHAGDELVGGVGLDHLHDA